MKRLLILASILISPISQAEGIFESVNCLALNIYHEARNQETKGQYAVALVTLNRVNSSRWPNSICGVVWQDRQFSWTQDGKSDRPHEIQAWHKSLGIAYSIIFNRNINDFTNGAVNYHADYVNPKWNVSLTKLSVIGSHIFYK